MICPKCGSTLDEGMKFCTNCGANIEKVEKELAKKKKEEESKRKQAEEARKQEELRKRQEEEQRKKEAETKRQEEIKREEDRIAEEKRKIEEEKKKLEEEKLKALREAEEIKRLKAEQEEKDRLAEGNAKKALEATGGLPEKTEEENSIDNSNNISSENESDEVIEKTAEDEFKPAKKQKRSGQKKKRKGFFRRLIDRIILLIVLIAILIGGVYYLNIKGYLPEVVSNEINSLIDQIKDVKDLMDKNYENEDEDENTSSSNKKSDEESDDEIEWSVANTIEADDIINLNEEVSAIVVDGKYGIIDNKSGIILLDTEYDKIFMSGDDIIVYYNNYYYNVDSMYQVAEEASTVVLDSDFTGYYYNISNDTAYIGIIDYYFQDVNDFKEENPDYISDYIVVEKIEFDESKTTETEVWESTYLEGAEYEHTGEYAVYDTKNNKLITDFDYSLIYGTTDAYAAVMKEKIAGFVKTTNGSEIMMEFEETRNVYDGVAWAKLDGKWGLVKVDK